MNHLSITGIGGRIMVGPYCAVELGKWSLDQAGGTYTLDYAPAKTDAYWVTRTADTVRLHLGKAVWEWRGVAVDPKAGNITLPSAPQKR